MQVIARDVCKLSRANFPKASPRREIFLSCLQIFKAVCLITQALVAGERPQVSCHVRRVSEMQFLSLPSRTFSSISGLHDGSKNLAYPIISTQRSFIQNWNDCMSRAGGPDSEFTTSYQITWQATPRRPVDHCLSTANCNCTSVISAIQLAPIESNISQPPC